MVRLGPRSEQQLVDVGAAFIQQAKEQHCLPEFLRAFLKLLRRKNPSSSGYTSEILKDLSWQRFAWGDTQHSIHWSEWLAMDDAERDVITEEMHAQFLVNQQRSRSRPLDEVFRVPGSSPEIAIDVDMFE